MQRTEVNIENGSGKKVEGCRKRWQDGEKQSTVVRVKLSKRPKREEEVTLLVSDSISRPTLPI